MIQTKYICPKCNGLGFGTETMIQEGTRIVRKLCGLCNGQKFIVLIPWIERDPPMEVLSDLPIFPKDKTPIDQLEEKVKEDLPPLDPTE